MSVAVVGERLHTGGGDSEPVPVHQEGGWRVVAGRILEALFSPVSSVEPSPAMSDHFNAPIDPVQVTGDTFPKGWIHSSEVLKAERERAEGQAAIA